MENHARKAYVSKKVAMPSKYYKQCGCLKKARKHWGGSAADIFKKTDVRIR
jgi:hypothetical protein